MQHADSHYSQWLVLYNSLVLPGVWLVGEQRERRASSKQREGVFPRNSSRCFSERLGHYCWHKLLAQIKNSSLLANFGHLFFSLNKVRTYAVIFLFLCLPTQYNYQIKKKVLISLISPVKLSHLDVKPKTNCNKNEICLI